MTKAEENEDFRIMQESSFGKWYNVTFIRDYRDYVCNSREFINVCSKIKLRLNNVNGWGTGTIFFQTEDNQLMVLNWKAIVSMIPCRD